MTSLSEGDSIKREYRHGNGNLRHVYSEDQTDTEFLEIQPEDSASHHGENAFYYQRMGNADVMRLDSSGHHGRTVRRSNSEPKLNEAAPGEHQEGTSSKSMINFPPRSSLDDQSNWRATGEAFQRNSQGKYVQSPILEETDSALEREMGSGYFLRPKAFLDYETRNRRALNGLAGFDSETHQTWQGALATQTAATGATNVQPAHRRPPLERELPYFDNRSSFLRHRVSLSKLNGAVGKKSSRSKQSGGQTNGDESESGSSNERSQRNSRRNSVSNAGAVTVNAANKPGKLTDDDRDSGIALNANQQLAHRSRFLEKKSIFTIAYDEVATAKLPAASDNLPT